MRRFMHRLIKEERASVVLEYTIIMPFIFLAVGLLIFIGYAEYQKAVMEAAVQRGVIKGTRMIIDPHYTQIISEDGSLDISGEQLKNVDFKDSKPYRYIGSLDDDIPGLRDDVLKYIDGYKLFDDNSKSGGSSVNVNATTKNYFVYQTITITATQSYSIPIAFGKFKPEVLRIEAQATAAVDDPDEFIRNADMAVDMVMYIGDKTGITSTIKTNFTKVREFIDKLFK